MAKLDELVLGQLEVKLFQKTRLKAILSKLIERNATKLDENHDRERQLRKELREAEEKIDRLYDALANGTAGNTDGFRRNVSKLEQQKDDLLRQVSGLNRRRNIPTNALTPANIDRFAIAARERLRNRDISFRKRYLRLFVERVEVRDNDIRISGPESALAKGISEMAKPGTDIVPSFVPEWWARQDSNLQPDGYEPSALTN